LDPGAHRARRAPRPHSPTTRSKRLLQKLTRGRAPRALPHTKYVGQKRFSLEGGESLIPSIDELIQRAGANGVQEIVLGMAHRGRLNVLVNVLGKMPADLFLEFEGKQPNELPSGDVKYHNGFSSDIRPPAGRCTCRSRSTRRTWRSSTPWSKAPCGRASVSRDDKTGRPGAADPGPRRRPRSPARAW
jgi:hypothetical protein